MFTEEIKAVLSNTRTISVLTGAGISTNSGIPDFQTIDHEWPFPVPRVEVLSRQFFYNHPEKFWDAYTYLFNFEKEIKPTIFHYAIAELERIFDVTVITQNIDGLHQKAGSTNVLEVHGSNHYSRSSSKKNLHERVLTQDLITSQNFIDDSSGKYYRPDITLFGEKPFHVKKSIKTISESDLLIVAGTALNVYPVAMFPTHRLFFQDNAESWWVNSDTPSADYSFTQEFIIDTDVFGQELLNYLNEDETNT